MNKKFNPIVLQQLINDCTGSVTKLENQIVDNSVSYELPNIGENQIGSIVNQDSTLNYNKIYMQLQKLIENGNNALEIISSIQPDVTNTEVMSSTASLMNAIKNCVSEFMKLQAINLKHKLNMQLEDKRQRNKIELLSIKNSFKNNQTQKQSVSQLKQFTDYTTSDIFRYLQEQKEKRQQKNN